jgi:uncharacterized membrane protein
LKHPKNFTQGKGIIYVAIVKVLQHISATVNLEHLKTISFFIWEESSTNTPSAVTIRRTKKEVILKEKYSI